jgi:hypothetical protein
VFSSIANAMLKADSSVVSSVLRGLLDAGREPVWYIVHPISHNNTAKGRISITNARFNLFQLSQRHLLVFLRENADATSKRLGTQNMYLN